VPALPAVSGPAATANLRAPQAASTEERQDSSSRVTFGQMLTKLVSSDAAPAAAVRPAPDATNVTGSAAGVDVVAAAQQYLGVPYRWGGDDPATGLDCSGLVQQVFDDLGVDMPRFSGHQAQQGEAVEQLADAQPGDLLFWSAGDGHRTNHIGIYVGDGQMLHAPRSGDVVRVGPMTRGTPHDIRRIV